MSKDGLNYRFDDFRLDVPNRQLWREDEQIDLNARYYDALVLLVREHGQLVEKDQFFSDVWGDVVVSDAALTQCIKDIRKRLGDDVANPRYIQTVPRYGYRFIGNVESVPLSESTPSRPPVYHKESTTTPREGITLQAPLRRALVDGAAGTLGGAIAGVCGGLLYGFGLAYAPGDAIPGIASLLVVLVSLSVIAGITGAFGISFGMAASNLTTSKNRWWSIAGAALGGLLVGGLAKLLGVDAFNLLFGRAPAGITGGLEGAFLGAALALGAQLAGGLNAARHWCPVLGAGLAGAVAGMLIPLAGGRLMGGSLALLANSFAGSHLHLDAIGRFFGEMHFGFTTQMVLSGIEGLLFGTCVVGAIVLAHKFKGLPALQ